MKNFLTSNDTWARLARTILQGFIGVVLANLDKIVDTMTISADWKPIIVALVMAILSPIMAELGKKTL